MSIKIAPQNGSCAIREIQNFYTFGEAEEEEILHMMANDGYPKTEPSDVEKKGWTRFHYYPGCGVLVAVTIQSQIKANAFFEANGWKCTPAFNHAHGTSSVLFWHYPLPKVKPPAPQEEVTQDKPKKEKKKPVVELGVDGLEGFNLDDTDWRRDEGDIF